MYVILDAFLAVTILLADAKWVSIAIVTPCFIGLNKVTGGFASDAVRK